MHGQPREILSVGEYSLGWCAKKVGVPDADKRQQCRHVLRERRAAEVFVHGVSAGQQLFELVKADGKCDGQSDRRP